eukprot:NODE_2548_length_916_cov_266.651568.p2 GENE.NODE_2548_length_916_cov_266.651568~~NODE_2548_length_916_cov_266.651568.p2  ORF type:complete len:240 (+),score=93.18 NODE_2548_length_916_cov_266.651568:33-752(+)
MYSTWGHFEYEHVNPVGAAVVFPPGYFHETVGTDMWATAITFQFQRPQPVKYIRDFLPRLVESPLGHEEKCHERWKDYVLFGRPAKPTLSESEMRARVEAIFEATDLDRNEIISDVELARLFEKETWASKPEFGWTSHKLSKADKAKMRAELIRFRIADTLVYHDLDGDAQISVAELWESTVQWNVVLHKNNRVNRMLKKSGASMMPWNKRFHGRDKVAAVEKEYDQLYRRPKPHSAEL